MKNYEIRLMADGCEFSRSYGFGDNALAAFESSVEQGQTGIPFGFSGDVVIINIANGLSFKFEVCQAQ